MNFGYFYNIKSQNYKSELSCFIKDKTKIQIIFKITNKTDFK